MAMSSQGKQKAVIQLNSDFKSRSTSNNLATFQGEELASSESGTGAITYEIDPNLICELHNLSAIQEVQICCYVMRRRKILTLPLKLVSITVGALRL